MHTHAVPFKLLSLSNLGEISLKTMSWGKLTENSSTIHSHSPQHGHPLIIIIIRVATVGNSARSSSPHLHPMSAWEDCSGGRKED